MCGNTLETAFMLSSNDSEPAIYVVCSPERVLSIFQAVEFELWVHSRIQIHIGKTQLWNKGKVPPPVWETLTAHAWRSDPDAIVWRDDRTLPEDQQGVKVLGTPLGSPEFVRARLLELSASHQRLVDKIPLVSDFKSAWLLLLFCAASRPNCILRVLHPEATREFATLNDTAMRRCAETLLDVRMDDQTWNVGSLPLSLGGLGLRSAVKGRSAAYWSSWADGLHMIRRRHALVTDLIIRELSSDQPAHHLEGVVRARNRLEDVGFNVPSGEALADGVRPEVNSLDDAGPGIPQHGWQFKATQNVDDFFMSTSIWPHLPDDSKALLRSQSGPLSGLPFTCCPTAFHSRFDAQVFRVLLLRRLWLHLPPSSRSCRCGRPLDVLGHHRAACANVGVLGRRGFALKSAAARVCREAAGRVSVNVAVCDLDIGVLDRADERPLEVVADGLPLFHGAQIAVDMTLVSVLRREGTPHPRCANEDGAALAQARRRKELRYCELAGQHGRAKLVFLASEVGGRWSEEYRQFLCQLASAKTRNESKVLRSRARQAWLHRWRSLLACSSARAFAMSLLERRGGTGADDPTSSTADVVWEARFGFPSAWGYALCFRPGLKNLLSHLFSEKMEGYIYFLHTAVLMWQMLFRYIEEFWIIFRYFNFDVCGRADILSRTKTVRSSMKNKMFIPSATNFFIKNYNGHVIRII